jgi:diguanylate cyclase (GGDEF)-like protein/PAS domain S-box-containing protein
MTMTTHDGGRQIEGPNLDATVRASGAGAETQLLRHLLDAVADAIVVVDHQLQISYANAAARTFLDIRGTASEGADAFGFVHKGDIDRVAGTFLELMTQPNATAIMKFRFTAGEHSHPVEAIATNLLHDANVRGVVVCFRNLTGEQSNLRRAEQLSAALEATTDLVSIHDATGALVHANDAARALLAELGGERPDLALYPAETRRLLALQAVPVAMRQGSWSGEARLSGRDGQTLDVSIVVTARCDEDGRLESYAVISRDIRERKLIEAELTRQATQDALTGLPNRMALASRLTDHLGSVRHGSVLAVLFIDLDNFKVVNDSLGHQHGDRLISVCAERISAVLRSIDTLARFGGDEFVALVPGLANRQEAQHVADRVCAALRDPVRFDGTNVYVSCSIGIAIADSPGSADAVIQQADLAMYEAKARGRNQVRFFEPTMHDAARRRLDLETELHGALGGDELVVAYQPIMALPGRTLRGFEALVRWPHPERGVILPDHFLDVAEQSGLITRVDTFVLGSACAELRRWSDWRGDDELFVAVNFSPRQLSRADLPDLIEATLAEHRLRPEQLHVEIIEGRLMDEISTTVDALTRIRSLGVRLAIDDFGTGHSSLSYLRRFDVHTLKIDRGFVEAATTDPGSAQIIEAITQLARTFCLETVAEGVETEAQLRVIESLGCDAAQGFFLGTPLSVHEADQLVAATSGHSLSRNSLSF